MAFGGAAACRAATAGCTVTAVGNVAAASSNSTRPARRPARQLARRPARQLARRPARQLARRPARQGARWRGPKME